MKHCTSDSKFVMVHVTCPSEQSASLARLLVTKKAAACVNIISNIRSIYRWQDKIEDDNENMLIIKTKTAALGKLSQLIKQHHPYELPEMIVTPIIAGLADYLNWIDTTIDNDAPDN
ncbi:MAG: hypothetical protein COC05_05980 [Gammaproteobacteria bacterium]|nr:MAG: hypothetical protein COC05_05980 [Gammaproteobacteria bacterium]